MHQFNIYWYMCTPGEEWPETVVRQLDPCNGGPAFDIYDFISENYNKLSDDRCWHNISVCTLLVYTSTCVCVHACDIPCMLVLK